MKKEHTPSLPRDGNLTSPWQDTQLPVFANQIKSDKVYDCLVIGAGITGVTSALLLAQSGQRVLVADAHKPGFGTTGGTTAHINTFADTTYKEAATAFGKDGAQLFAAAIDRGHQIIRENIRTLGIECDYEELSGFVYAETDEEANQLDDVFEGTKDVNVPVSFCDDIPIPIPFIKAIRLDGQAKFHPMKYLEGLLREFTKLGGAIVEHCKIERTERENDYHRAYYQGGSFRAKKIVYATHTPPGINVFSFRCAPYRSYVIAVRLKNDGYPNGLIYDMREPYHYFRTHHIDGQKLLIVGGNDHKTGHDDPSAAFSELEKYTAKYFSISTVQYRWSSQYYVPVDGLPYVGQIPFYPEGIYTATGYNGNGMMLGSISAEILVSLVLGKDHPYADLFSPSRLKPIDGFTEFVKENADAAYHFIADRLCVDETDSLKRLRPGTGKVVKVNGRKCAAYRDEKGEIHALSAVCTHAGCIVAWNQEEKSWDCPCHGARFDIEGHVLNGQASVDLPRFE